MKKILKLLFIASFILSLTNCNNEELDNVVSEVNVIINNSDDYELDLKISGDEEGATIKTQAKYFQKSELIRDSSTNWSVVYKYEPLPSYSGMDVVEIKTCTGGGSGGCSNIEIVRINFTINN